jgi:hypothetical protein
VWALSLVQGPFSFSVGGAQGWSGERRENGSLPRPAACQVDAPCRADLAPQCVRYRNLKAVCTATPASFLLILAIIGLLAFSCTGVSAYICYYRSVVRNLGTWTR